MNNTKDGIKEDEDTTGIISKLEKENLRLKAEVYLLKYENALLSKLEALTKTSDGIQQLIKENSDRINSTLVFILPYVLPYLKGCELILALVSKKLLQTIRNDSNNGDVGNLPIQDPAVYLCSKSLAMYAFEDLSLQELLIKQPDRPASNVYEYYDDYRGEYI